MIFTIVDSFKIKTFKHSNIQTFKHSIQMDTCANASDAVNANASNAANAANAVTLLNVPPLSLPKMFMIEFIDESHDSHDSRGDDYEPEYYTDWKSAYCALLKYKLESSDDYNVVLYEFTGAACKTSSMPLVKSGPIELDVNKLINMIMNKMSFADFKKFTL